MSNNNAKDYERDLLNFLKKACSSEFIQSEDREVRLNRGGPLIKLDKIADGIEIHTNDDNELIVSSLQEIKQRRLFRGRSLIGNFLYFLRNETYSNKLRDKWPELAKLNKPYRLIIGFYNCDADKFAYTDLDCMSSHLVIYGYGAYCSFVEYDSYQDLLSLTGHYSDDIREQLSQSYLATVADVLDFALSDKCTQKLIDSANAEQAVKRLHTHWQPTEVQLLQEKSEIGQRELYNRVSSLYDMIGILQERYYKEQKRTKMLALGLQDLLKRYNES